MTTKRIRRTLTLVAVGALMTAACAAPGTGSAGSGSLSSSSRAEPSGQASAPPETPAGPTAPVHSTGPDSGPTQPPLEGTTWYQTLMINNDLSIRLAVDPARWIEFSAGELTFNGITESDGMGGGYDCPTLTVPATVVDGVVVYGEGAFDSEGARAICGTKTLLNQAEGKVTPEQDGRQLRITNDEGMNTSVLVFSADEPSAPTVPDSVDLSFLPPATKGSVQERLANDLRGKNFAATDITGRKLVGDGIRMDFRVDQVGLNAGCNGGGAGYRVADAAIEFTGGAWTEMACEDALMDQEQWLMQFVAGTVAYELDGEVLRLTKESESMTLREISPPAGEPTEAEISGSMGAGPDDSALMQIEIDEIITADGRHPLPDLEPGDFWGQPAHLTVVADAIGFDSGCGQLFTDTTGTDDRIAWAYNGDWLTECPPKRAALSDALRYILSGELHIDQDGPFITITGRDGIKVTAHTSL